MANNNGWNAGVPQFGTINQPGGFNYGVQSTPQNPQYNIQAPQYNPAPQPKPMTCRLINALEDIKPNDVPMDGSIGVYPLQDFSAIYAKAWRGDGTIATFKFVPVPDDNPIQNTNISTEILNKLNNIEDLLNKKNYNKKEVIPNGSQTNSFKSDSQKS